jgi:thermostable 8-oxoguanine DNA glycosylase
MQIESHYVDGKNIECPIPDADQELLTDVIWGEVDHVFTPAFWRFACITGGALQGPPSYRLGETFGEEVVACLLGGHGVTGELGNAAFAHLKGAGVFDLTEPTEGAIEELLSEPLLVNGHSIRYRFPRQKARYVAGALRFVNKFVAPVGSPRARRDWLLVVPGIRLKTALWVVRNWTDSNDVAILDIHIHRAGVLANLFDPNDDVQRGYRAMEDKFVRFAEGIGVPASILDNEIWCRLRHTPRLVRQMLIERGVKPTDRCGLPPTQKRRAPRNYDLFANA